VEVTPTCPKVLSPKTIKVIGLMVEVTHCNVLYQCIIIYNWGDPVVDGRIVLGWIFRKWDVGVWTGLG
jgi:hypothetical protein